MTDQATTPDTENLIWIDLEMTGLEPESDRIIELAIVVTDANLNLIADGPALAIHQDQAALEAMDEWNTHHHGQSGLTRRVCESRLDEAAGEQACLKFLADWTVRESSPMCGNSICQDRRFLARWMPELEAWFHYRNLDVSTLKELCRRWSPELAAGVHKKASHRALDDIRESISELAYYREHFLRLP